MTDRDKGIICGTTSGLSWGLNAVLIGLAMSYAPFLEHPILLLAGTFVYCMLHDLVAALAMSTYITARGLWTNVLRALRSRDAIYCVLAALFGGPLAMSLYMMAIEHSGAALAAATTACYPLIGSALAVLLLREKMTTKAWIGLLICVVGVAYLGIMTSGDDTLGKGAFLGVLLALGAAIGWATEGVISAWGMKSNDISPEIALFIREWTSALAYLFVVCPIFVGSYDEISSAVSAACSHTDTWMMLTLAALVGVFSFLMWYTSIKKIGASPALCLNVTYSFWSILFSIVLTGADFSWTTAIGASLVVLGVCYSVINNKQ